MKVLRITENERTANHYSCPLQGDLTLCGLEAGTGDPNCGISPPQKIEGKITCPDCIAIINHCKKIKAQDIG